MGETYNREMVKTKAELLTNGVHISSEVSSAFDAMDIKQPRMVRSGMSGGIEFYINDGANRYSISCSATSQTQNNRQHRITELNNRFVLMGPDNKNLDISLLPVPSFYTKKTSSGKQMGNIAQQSFSKLAIGVFGNCFISNNPSYRCKFCGIHTARLTDATIKTDQDIIETVDVAFNSNIGPSLNTIMLGGGTPAIADHGTFRFANLAKKIKEKKYPATISVMMLPPKNTGDIQKLKDAGVDYISINMEFGSEKAMQEYTPGKARLVGIDGYKEALSESVNVFGKGNVQSLLIVGLESEENTLKAVEWMSSNGVIPVLSPFRPIPNTELSAKQTMNADKLIGLYNMASELATKNGAFLGPQCTNCQCNTMSFPWDVKKIQSSKINIKTTTLSNIR